jgi:hypothetical protein
MMFKILKMPSTQKYGGEHGIMASQHGAVDFSGISGKRRAPGWQVNFDFDFGVTYSSEGGGRRFGIERTCSDFYRAVRAGGGIG